MKRLLTWWRNRRRPPRDVDAELMQMEIRERLDLPYEASDDAVYGALLVRIRAEQLN